MYQPKGAVSLIEQDTIRLLRECDSGVKMGVDAIEDVMDCADDRALKQMLIDCKKEHEKLGREIQTMLNRYQDEGKDPNPIVKGMSWLKTGTRLVLDGSDSTIATLMTDGCNMGIRSLSKYLNEYEAADEQSKNAAKRLIRLEEQLAVDLRPYL